MGTLNDLEKLDGQMQRLIAEQASGWVQVMRNPSVQERAEFARWLKKNERHASEYLLMEALDRDLSGIDAEHRHSVSDLVAGLSTVTAMPGARAVHNKRRQWFTGLAAAAAFGAVAVGAWWLSPLSGREWQDIRTQVGEQRVLQLDDGSTVHLNTRSHLRIHLSADARDLQLLSGEALFDVARDARRPFRVQAGETTVRALGTQFNVYRKTGATEVAVLEGKVEVLGAGAAVSLAPPTLLSAGEQAQVRTSGAVSKQSGDITRATAWQQRRLMFRLDSLADIAAEFNRYNRAPRIVIEGEAARTRQFSGVFDADRPQDFAQMVAGDDSLAVERGGKAIVIRAR